MCYREVNVPIQLNFSISATLKGRVGLDSFICLLCHNGPDSLQRLEFWLMVRIGHHKGGVMGMVNQVKPALSYVQYAECLSTLYRNKGCKLFFKAPHDYTVLFHKKDDYKVLREGYNPLTLSRITNFGMQFKNELIADPHADEVADLLKQMGDRKVANENRRYFFMRFIQKVIDCTINFFQGKGLRSTAALTYELSEWLKTNIKRSPPPLEEVNKTEVPTGRASNNSTPTAPNNTTDINRSLGSQQPPRKTAEANPYHGDQEDNTKTVKRKQKQNRKKSKSEIKTEDPKSIKTSELIRDFKEEIKDSLVTPSIPGSPGTPINYAQNAYYIQIFNNS